MHNFESPSQFRSANFTQAECALIPANGSCQACSKGDFADAAESDEAIFHVIFNYCNDCQQQKNNTIVIIMIIMHTT
jgi:hypothetical protein